MHEDHIYFAFEIIALTIVRHILCLVRFMVCQLVDAL